MLRQFRTLMVTHSSSTGILLLTVGVLVIGVIENIQPFGIRFRDLTGGIISFDTLVRIGIFTNIIIGLNLLMGFAGQISLGHAAFYGMGAYISAILTTMAIRHDVFNSFSLEWWWPWLVILIGMLLTGSLAYIVGKIILRLRGNYLAMATLGMGIVVYTLFREGTNITGGNDGIPGIPRLSIGDEFQIWPLSRYFILVWGITILLIVIGLNIVNSRTGRALRAISSRELVASVFGVDTAQAKLQILVISAMMASLAGSLYAHFQAIVAPSSFHFIASVELVTMAVVGGLTSIWGAAFGVAFILVLKEIIRSQFHIIMRGAGGEHELILYGIILVFAMIVIPHGLWLEVIGRFRNPTFFRKLLKKGH